MKRHGAGGKGVTWVKRHGGRGKGIHLVEEAL